jgi:hypothetical protein
MRRVITVVGTVVASLFVVVGVASAGPEAVEVTVYGSLSCDKARISMQLGPEDTCVEGNDRDVPPGMNPDQVSRVVPRWR